MHVRVIIEQAENAFCIIYFVFSQMDNVLIDDRRIHVDFSQSVSQLWTRYRRFGKRDRDDGGGLYCVMHGAFILVLSMTYSTMIYALC
jgi:hypothetical protein